VTVYALSLKQPWAALLVHGAGDLTGCLAYRSVEAFAADGARHLNDPSWFRPPVLYGFTFVNLCALPFRRYPGYVRFFPVEEGG
jgi:hypothetical protein